MILIRGLRNKIFLFLFALILAGCGVPEYACEDSDVVVEDNGLTYLYLYDCTIRVPIQDGELMPIEDGVEI